LNVYAASRATSNKSAAEALGIEEEDILLHNFHANDVVLCPKFILFKDRVEEAVVLAIRGTSSFRDAVTDVVMEENRFLDGFAHQGILEGSLHILDLAKEAINKALTSLPQYKLLLTGHSLGGGAAQLVYLKLKMADDINCVPTGTEISCLALAPPPVFRPLQAIPDDVRERISIFILNNDLVPRLSLANLALLVKKLRKIDDLKIPLRSMVAIIADKVSSHEEAFLKQIKEILPQVAQDEFAFLQHPGQIIHLRDNKNKIKLHRAESATFASSLLFLENMLNDHKGKSYEKALNAIQQTSEEHVASDFT